MTTITINNGLKISNFEGDEVNIDLLKGNYVVNYNERQEEIFISPEGKNIELDSIPRSEWDFVGEDGYSSLGSDIIYYSVQDSKNQESNAIDPYELEDVMTGFKSFGQFCVVEIPCGTGGSIYIYTKTNIDGKIDAILINGEVPEDFYAE